ncbi:beta-galactosidase BoGH2A-like [Sycon ciliatum]|uniref:beta-galactosidase BoGH2A-like n=1 Tax=Sycon ciliatum TaxID=27933 RepID=UPI0031F6437E
MAAVRDLTRAKGAVIVTLLLLASTKHANSFATKFSKVADQTNNMQPSSPAALAQPRQHVTFDYGWRFRFGHAPDGAPGPGDTTFTDISGYGCSNMEHNPNRFTPYDCMVGCAYNPECMVWQQDNSGRRCYHGQANAECSKSTKPQIDNGGQRNSAPPLRTEYKFAAKNFTDSDWRVVDVPHDFVVEGDFVQTPDSHHGYLLRNVSWYRKSFHIPQDWQGSYIQIYFEGVFHVAQIWVNGQYVQTHTCGYTGFTVRLDNITSLEYGTAAVNVIAVRVDASFGSGHWYEGGGIYRKTYLIATGHTHFVHSGVFVSPEIDLQSRTAHASVEVETFSSASQLLTVSFTLYDPSGEVMSTNTTSHISIQPGTPQIVSMTLSVTKVTPWSIQQPSLYTVRAELVNSSDESVVDSRNLTVGFRQTSWSGASGFALNGKALKFRGFSHHNSFTGVGTAIPDRVHLFRAQASRAVGGSFWRMSHNPYLPVLYEFLDAVGILVWDENRDYGMKYVGEMHDMVKSHRNHPSIVVWSFCNEVECQQVTNQTGLSFRAIAKSLDPQRPTAANGGTDGIDIQGMSHGHNESFIGFHEKNPEVPTVLSECCSCQTQRLSRDATTTCMHDQNSPGLLPYVAGSLGVWTLFDYYGESFGWPRVSCSFGNFDLAGFPKPHAYWYVLNWLAMIPMDDPGRPLYPAVDMTRILELPSQIGNTVAVFSSGASVEVFVDGKSTGHQENTNTGEAMIFNMTTSTPATCNYTHNLTGVQCIGLNHSKANSASDCEAACCAAKETCTVWQYAEKENGCWIGNVDLSRCTGADENWVGGGSMVTASNVTAVGRDASGKVTSSHALIAAKEAHTVQLTLDAPSPTTGTGTKLVLDGHDAALVGASVVDANGVVVTDSTVNITFSVVSGPGRLIAVGNGDNYCHQNAKSDHIPVYGGHARGIFQVTVDCVSNNHDMCLAIDVDQGPAKVQAGECADVENIVIKASSDGLAPGTLSIPVSGSVDDLPLEVAKQSKDLSGYTYLETFVG